jgi:hypothetical protein
MKRGWPKISVYFGLVIVPFLYYGTFLFNKGGHYYNRHGKLVPTTYTFIWMLFFISAFTTLLLYLLRFLRINNTSITINNIFGTKKIFTDDITNIDLFSIQKKPSQYEQKINIKISVLGEKDLYIPDSHYRSIYKIKQFLVDNFNDKISPLPTVSKTVNPENIVPEKFTGNPYISFAGFYILLSILMDIGIFSQDTGHAKNEWVMPIALILFPLIAFFLGGINSYYFITENDTLTVNNYFFPWINKVYKREDIIEANFYRRPKASNALQVITRDYKSTIYAAGSIRDKTWPLFIKKLKTMKINFSK